MEEGKRTQLAEIIGKNQEALLDAWIREQLSAPSSRLEIKSESELRRESGEFLGLFLEAYRSGDITRLDNDSWQAVFQFLATLSRSRSSQGFTPSETAAFVLSLKGPLFSLLQQEYSQESVTLTRELLSATVLLDRLGLYTTEVFQKGREEIIKRQQMELLELSTPVVKIWEGILILPLIGTLDSSRTQIVMENLLQRIVDTSSTVAIIDITGVPAVDTLVAQHLMKTVAAARLMGAQCIVSGIRPQIAQTMVQLGVAFGDVVTRASLADALELALRQRGLAVARRSPRTDME